MRRTTTPKTRVFSSLFMLIFFLLPPSGVEEKAQANALCFNSSQISGVCIPPTASELRYLSHGPHYQFFFFSLSPFLPSLNLSSCKIRSNLVMRQRR